TLIWQQVLFNPLGWVALLLGMTMRLWAGSWNDYHYQWMRLAPYTLDIIQDTLLFLCLVGLVLLTLPGRRRIRRREIVSAGVLAAIVGSHFVYVLVDPVSRFAHTAMP